MMNAPRNRARIMRQSDHASAPNEVWVEFSVWPDGTVEVEDFSTDNEARKPHWVKYTRAEQKESSDGS
jgi:hypothetical protein